MVAEKSGPSFASILTIVSFVIYTGGLVRIEVKFNKQKEKIHKLESIVKSMKISNNDVARVNTILRNRRSDFSMNNKTENERMPGENFTSDTEIVTEMRQKLCQSSIDRCSQGPPGPPGSPGPRGERGKQGRRGKKGDNGIMGPPGRSGKQGIMGPPGSKGETELKGEKGNTGTAGMKGAKGEPGESIAAPTVAVSPAKMTVNESKTASFQCSVSGNPKPVSTWSKLEGKSEKILSATTDGKLILPNAAGSDSGVYKCSASNILGQAHALVRLAINSKLC
ncbi:collagen alpha-1(XVII) chain-like [Acropora millepora]|uniref:collagen alpha-1(XVII) chain-like n=1 Tax=Acropora millepora TaxID=45264 RepID=UPI001CF30D62|nr:collagen alpha-1(XVII) chain-like [Acropora millepora]